MTPDRVSSGLGVVAHPMKLASTVSGHAQRQQNLRVTTISGRIQTKLRLGYSRRLPRSSPGGHVAQSHFCSRRPEQWLAGGPSYTANLYPYAERASNLFSSEFWRAAVLRTSRSTHKRKFAQGSTLWGSGVLHSFLQQMLSLRSCPSETYEIAIICAAAGVASHRDNQRRCHRPKRAESTA